MSVYRILLKKSNPKYIAVPKCLTELKLYQLASPIWNSVHVAHTACMHTAYTLHAHNKLIILGWSTYIMYPAIYTGEAKGSTRFKAILGHWWRHCVYVPHNRGICTILELRRAFMHFLNPYNLKISKAIPRISRQIGLSQDHAICLLNLGIQDCHCINCFLLLAWKREWSSKSFLRLPSC